MFCRAPLCENDKYVKLPRCKATLVGNRTTGGFQLIRFIDLNCPARLPFAIGLMNEPKAIAPAI